MKVCLYARVSTDDQTIEQQLTAMRKYCEFNEWEIVAEYTEKISGAMANRAEFRKLFKDYWNKGYKAIIVWKLDRFSRERLSVVLGYIEKLRRSGVGVISVTESWLNTTKENPVSDLVLSVMAWAACEERRKISENTKRGMAERKAAGVHVGRPKGSKDKKPRAKRGVR